MFQITNPSKNLIEIQPNASLKEDDFKELAGMADKLIAEYGTIRLLINAAHFKGWANFEAAEKHFKFVKGHHEKVERLAMVAPHEWQKWIIAVIKVFVHPEVKVFEESEIEKARAWVKG